MSAALWSRSCPSLLSTLLQLHNNTLPVKQHQIDKTLRVTKWFKQLTYLSTHTVQGSFCAFLKKNKYILPSNQRFYNCDSSRSSLFCLKFFMKNMPLKPRPLKNWEVIVVFKQPFSHSPSFIRTTARLCCVEGSCNVRASVSLLLTAWRYSSTILLCVHLKVQIKPVTFWMK